MSAPGADPGPGAWEAINAVERRYQAAVREYEQELADLPGHEASQCLLRWEQKYADDPEIGRSVVNYVNAARKHLLIDASRPSLQLTGDGNVVLQPSGGSAATYGPGQAVSEGVANMNRSASALRSQATTSLDYALLVSIVAGAIAAWWVPKGWIADNVTRGLVTTGLLACGVTYGAIRYFDFRRRTWAKRAYLALGTLALLRALGPELLALFVGSGELATEAANASLFSALVVDTRIENPWPLTVLGGFILLLSFLSKPEEQ